MDRRNGWSVLAALALLALAPAALAQDQGDDDDLSGCYIDGSRGIVDCTGKQGQSKEGFWTGPVAQTIYALVGLGGAAGGFIFGYTRVRRRRKTLRALHSDAEAAFVGCKNEPQAGIERLAGIRAELAVRHENGHVGDTQFLTLDKQIAGYVAKLRMLEIERLFPRLPLELFREIRLVIEDGHLSMQEAERIESHAADLKVAPTTRKALKKHLQTWVGSDANKAPAKPAQVEVVVVQP